jgi:type IV secretory pathway VirD2 relaxase
VAIHLRYIEREGVTREGRKGQAYGPGTDTADVESFQARGRDDRHQFRFIVSAEDGAELEDLKTFTRQLMTRMEADLETHLDWVAVDHWDTDNPHTHIVLNGHTAGPGSRRDLVIAPEYMAHGMRLRASEIATEWLGPRTEIEMHQSLEREVDQPRLTHLDRALIRKASIDGISLTGNLADESQTALRGRLQKLETWGLAERVGAHRWNLKEGIASTLEAMGRQEDALHTVRRALKGQQRECVFHDRLTSAVVGRIAGKGLVDELGERGYLVVDGLDGRAHYLELPAGADLAEMPVNGVVEVAPPGQERSVDREILRHTRAGIYATSDHAATLRQSGDRDAQATVELHLRRLEALRRGGLVERLSDGVWKVPPDFADKVRALSERRGLNVSVVLRSHLPLRQQVGAIGVTWLDRQLVGTGLARSDSGFGAEVEQALRDRSGFLVRQGAAKRHGQRVIFVKDLLSTLRERDLTAAAKVLAERTGHSYRPASDGARIQGVYRHSIQLASGKFAVLDCGMNFTLVPWSRVLEGRAGQTLSAVMRGGSASWSVARQKEISM